MTIRSLSAAVALVAFAGSAFADVHELSIFRQLAARARNAATDLHNSTNTSYGPFNDTQSAMVTGAGAASCSATQNTSVDPGIYSGMIHAEATAAGSSSSLSEATCAFGSAPNNFQTTFSVAFMVDEPTLAHFTGSAFATRTGSLGSIVCQCILGDTLNGVPQGSVIFAQPAANAPTATWDQTVMLQPLHRYSLTANVNASQSNSFNSASGSTASTINFTAVVPTPGAASLLGLAGLCVLRRRR